MTNSPVLHRTGRNSWHILPRRRCPGRKLRVSTTEFRKNSWEKAVGPGGIFAEYLDHDLTILPYITSGKERRNKPIWANEKYSPPCAYACPTLIPSHQRATLIRQGLLQESLELVLRYSPLPATVCGQVCPNLCMNSCTRGLIDKPLAIDKLGSMALDLPAPQKEKPTNHRVAVIGGGPGGLSAAWQLALKATRLICTRHPESWGQDRALHPARASAAPDPGKGTLPVHGTRRSCPSEYGHRQKEIR